ncbi:MAG: four helix bundle protein [Chthoniobacterales bacterium]
MRNADFGLRKTELTERTLQFGIRCIKLAEGLPKSLSGQVLAKQLIRSGTSVGANYRVACRARSRAEFVAKLGIVEEECDETLYWMNVISKLQMVPSSKLEKLSKEGDEILSIIISSIKTARQNAKSSA